MQCLHDSTAIESLSLIRTPKYEIFLEKHQRGVHVSFERHHDDEVELLQKFEYRKDAALVRIRTTSSREYELDVRRIDARDLRAVCTIVRRMNHGGRFQVGRLAVAERTFCTSEKDANRRE